MGNCLGGVSNVENTLSSRTNTSGTAHGVYKSNVSSALSSLTVPTHSERSTSGSLYAYRSEEEILSSPHLRSFTLNELKKATQSFRSHHLIGEGGFGYVYKGWIDESSFGTSRSGTAVVVAIKKLKPEGLQGHKEWLCEVNYLGQLHHPNLVKLIGYCVDGDNRLLVYEYMPKGSLENHLFRRSARPLSWALRMRIAIDAARGLSFLHNSEEQVIYRDFKASNILLDSEFNAKLSDFGLAKNGPTGDQTHVSTQVMGTHGYAAPEYMATGRLTTKCDVYSFGVVLLELLSGRRAVEKTKTGTNQNLVNWARPFLGDKRKLFRIMDTRLEGQYSKKGATKVAFTALQCLGHAKDRPLMSEIVQTLEKLPQHSVPPSSSPTRHSCHASPLHKNKSPRGSPMPQFLKSPLVKFPHRQPRV